MKNKLSTAVRHCKKKVIYIFLFCLYILPAISFGQPAPPGPGGTGGNPDTPLGGVPFDNKLNLLLLIAGVMFAIVVLRNSQKKQQFNKIELPSRSTLQ
jgi:hypothetical protein